MTFVETGFPGLVIVEPRIFTDGVVTFKRGRNDRKTVSVIKEN